MSESGAGGPVLAIYDFRSKQEFIYRTNKMREITGGSELIANMYREFLALELPCGKIWNDWRSKDPKPVLNECGVPAFQPGYAGIVVYEGGGNLCVLFRDKAAYVAANKEFSRHVIKSAYSLSLITGCAEWDATKPFDENRTRMHRALDLNKRVGSFNVPCNVLPFTQVDRASFQAIDEQGMESLCGDFDEWERLWWESIRSQDQLTRESKMKLASFFRKAKRDPAWFKEGRHIDEIGTEKGEDSLVAVVYFDGNSIGETLKQEGGTIEGMRGFSTKVHEALVEKTEAAMKEAIGTMPDERQREYRVIIDHGDEITLICNAHAAPFAIEAYFKALKGFEACAGMAICHAHDPFSEVYKIAEECCESGKKKNRERMSCCSSDEERARANASYVDFHFCRSGITGELDQIRDAQERGLHNRPYCFSSESNGMGYRKFLEVGELLGRSKLTRSDFKELNRAILKGESWYLLECERLKAKDPETFKELEDGVGQVGDIKQLLFDITSFWDVFDVRFKKKYEEGAEDDE